ncbi:D-amino acid dehydrogenase [Rubrivivax sp. A210]|uniref:D-amino acid dehydrogenase n=1 Tax=Rubrivivax sp. A210 TaxID=2772301 RepID=UPI0019199902|nr:D-amino acid dehydrogenase [Rubrivivax sp. A210]CAD5367302.1 D-amino acid dehydrogenase [Rubrivivax sp. A210]
MRVALVGAGIVGVTTAYELAALGHEVTVFERRGSVAAEASFANAGVVAPGYVTPWAAPGMSIKVLRHLFARHAAVRFGGASALAQLPWMWRWWRACRPAAYGPNRAAMHRLASFSRERMLELTRSLRLDYEQMPGWTVLLRDERELRGAQAGLALLRELGVAHDVVDGTRARQLEPGLNPETPLHAAIHLAQDGVGNCRQFAHLLKAEAQRLGAVFRFDASVRSLAPGTRPALQLVEGSIHEAEAIVICAGVQANALLAGIGCRLPLAPVYGYSITAPLRHMEGAAHHAPRAALMDERYKVAISRLGMRVRVSGSAEIGGTLEHKNPAALRTLYKVLDDWFPGAVLVREAQAWKGARPMLPDGPPVLGESGAPGIWLNLGHGSSGWALACGSARVLAERLSGRAAPIDTGRLTLARLRGEG